MLINNQSINLFIRILTFLLLFSDVEFTYFLTKSNETLLKSYITDIVQKMKRSLPDQTWEQISCCVWYLYSQYNHITPAWRFDVWWL